MRRRLQKFSESFEEYAADPATVSNLTMSQFTSSYKEDKEEVIAENKQKHIMQNEVETTFEFETKRYRLSP
eukprot:8469794-Ditylum_brightwellii.AAC.1